jgi:hypothetical protein
MGDLPDYVVMNAGSEVAGERGEGWSNTVETARETAARWLRQMHEEGMAEVVLLPGELERDHRWCFRFRHTVTGAEVELETHGIDDMAAYERQHIFDPRVYWHGSSSGTPQIEDFGAPGYRVHQTFRPVEEGGGG